MDADYRTSTQIEQTTPQAPPSIDHEAFVSGEEAAQFRREGSEALAPYAQHTGEALPGPRGAATGYDVYQAAADGVPMRSVTEAGVQLSPSQQAYYEFLAAESDYKSAGGSDSSEADVTRARMRFELAKRDLGSQAAADRAELEANPQTVPFADGTAMTLPLEDRIRRSADTYPSLAAQTGRRDEVVGSLITLAGAPGYRVLCGAGARSRGAGGSRALRSPPWSARAHSRPRWGAWKPKS